MLELFEEAKAARNSRLMTMLSRLMVTFDSVNLQSMPKQVEHSGTVNHAVAVVTLPAKQPPKLYTEPAKLIEAHLEPSQEQSDG